MAVTSGQVAMNSSTATQIVAAANVNTIYVGHGQTQRYVALINLDASNDVFIGGPGVTTGTGMKLAHGATAPTILTLAQGDAIYGICSSSTPTVSYIESGT